MGCVTNATGINKLILIIWVIFSSCNDSNDTCFEGNNENDVVHILKNRPSLQVCYLELTSYL